MVQSLQFYQKETMIAIQVLIPLGLLCHFIFGAKIQQGHGRLRLTMKVKVVSVVELISFFQNSFITFELVLFDLAIVTHMYMCICVLYT